MRDWTDEDAETLQSMTQYLIAEKGEAYVRDLVREAKQKVQAEEAPKKFAADKGLCELYPPQPRKEKEYE